MKTTAMGVSLRRQVIWGFTYVKARWSSTQEIAENHRDSPTNVQLKPGEWLCTNCNFLNFARNIKCNFLNFAKNSRCLQCKENPPKRLLHPGEWFNYINFRRNMVCLKCDHRRHRASHSVTFDLSFDWIFCRRRNWPLLGRLQGLVSEVKTCARESVILGLRLSPEGSYLHRIEAIFGQDAKHNYS
ncbi:unnamed protein product [Cuscuta campestris]|uniref:RanBP2-type domain-containing protein n=1 Tax=Cuscuta campestris TaxID=132261 RepID=A0A484LQK3_9ASTE|nr:unnamed protein product [Cuscuta campestris]